MPTLREMLHTSIRFLETRGISVGEQCARDWEIELRRAYANERTHYPPPDSRKDPARAEAIREAAKRLPTGVVSERFGVTRSYVYKVTKK